MLDRAVLIAALSGALPHAQRIEAFADAILAAVADQTSAPQLAVYAPLLETLAGHHEGIIAGGTALSFGIANDMHEATITVGDVAGGNIVKDNTVTITVPITFTAPIQTVANHAPNLGAQGIFNAPVNIYHGNSEHRSIHTIAELAAAKELLDHMPLDEVPNIAPLPPGSRMQLRPNALFVGREADLHTLAASLKGGTTTVIAAATGLGGIGKTQLAIEFAHRYGSFFAGGVQWLSFAEAASVRTEVALCGGPEGLNLRTDFSSLSLDDQVALVRAAWNQPMPRLLIFDNCEEPEVLRAWLPTTGGARVLVTSRRPHWPADLDVQTHPLGLLTPDESAALFQRFRADLTPADARAIAAELGNLPLAIHLAGSFLKLHPRMSAVEYLMRVRLPGLLTDRSLRVEGRLPSGHERDVARTFALSFDQLAPDTAPDSLARQLLARAACFAPSEPLPYELLLVTVDLPEDADPLDADDALARLVNLGLLEIVDTATVRIHRLLASFVTSVARDSRAQPNVEYALLHRMKEMNEIGNPRLLLPIQIHLRTISTAASKRVDQEAAQICDSIGNHLYQIGSFHDARFYFECALTIVEQVLGPTHRDTAMCLNNLGLLLKEQGDLAGARSYDERALAIVEQVLGPIHLDTTIALNNLGTLLHMQGDLTGARPYLERALAIREQMLGPTHRDTATSLNNLGLLLQEQGDLTGARPYLERALTIAEQVLGLNHRDTATSLNNLAMLLKEQGDLTGARSYYERALTITEQVLGPTHSDSATILNNLAILLKEQGDLTGARSYYERALTITEQVLGPLHPNIAAILSNLAMLLKEQGDLGGARPYYERALTIIEQVLGPLHPNTAAILNNLAMLLKEQGDLAGAHLYFERTLAIVEQVLGPTHPWTATTLNNLGGLLEQQGNLAGACPYYERALTIREQVLGPTHLTTVASLNKLGGLLQEQGNLAGARPYYERALTIREQVLGPTHRDTAMSLNYLGLLLKEQGDLAEARPYLERALVIVEQALGPTHLWTATAFNNLGGLLEQQGDLVGARLYLKRALAIFRKALGARHSTTRVVHTHLAALNAQIARVGSLPKHR